MPFITREDGEHFVVPSYRDVITAKNTGLLKKEILTLSQSYGEYITLQKKNATQYEVAFSSDTGYLLGESVWHHFHRPQDMIYCEAIPNTSEAILVIVKSGSVYLDGTFPTDNIIEELVVFLTQQNNFDIYTYGDVPISQEPQEGKFAFEASSVSSFTILEEPVFPTLPLLRIYQLRLVATVLEEHGIGVFPTRKILTALAFVMLGYVAYSIITSEKVQEVQIQVMQIAQEDPYVLYYQTLASPAPDVELNEVVKTYNLFSSIPGWKPGEMEYKENVATSNVTTKGAMVQGLLDFAKIKNINIDFDSNGFKISKEIRLSNRPFPIGAQPINETLARLIDRLHNVQSGNIAQVAAFTMRGKIKTTAVTLSFQNISPSSFSLISELLDDLPVKVMSIKIGSNGNQIDSTIILQVVGT